MWRENKRTNERWATMPTNHIISPIHLLSSKTKELMHMMKRFVEKKKDNKKFRTYTKIDLAEQLNFALEKLEQRERDIVQAVGSYFRQKKFHGFFLLFVFFDLIWLGAFIRAWIELGQKLLSRVRILESQTKTQEDQLQLLSEELKKARSAVSTASKKKKECREGGHNQKNLYS